MWQLKLSTTYLIWSAGSAITHVNSLQHCSSAIEKCKVHALCSPNLTWAFHLLTDRSSPSAQLWWHVHKDSQRLNTAAHGCTVFSYRQSSLECSAGSGRISGSWHGDGTLLPLLPDKQQQSSLCSLLLCLFFWSWTVLNSLLFSSPFYSTLLIFSYLFGVQLRELWILLDCLQSCNTDTSHRMATRSEFGLADKILRRKASRDTVNTC